MSTAFSRRGFLKGLAASSGAALGTRLAGREWLPEARAAERSVLVCVYLEGGYNSLFSSAGSFTGSGAWTVTDNNVTNLGNGLIVDKRTLGGLAPYTRAHMASVGVRHGLSAHNAARAAMWSADPRTSYAVQLAAAMGGPAPIKAAMIGEPILQMPTAGAVDGVSLQRIVDMKSTIAALGGDVGNTRAPDREIAAAAMDHTRAMSAGGLAQNPENLVAMKNGYDTALDTLRRPVVPFDFASLATAYGHDPDDYLVSNVGGGPGVKGTLGVPSPLGLRSKFVAAELMVRAGANVVVLKDRNWDTHADNSGAAVRSLMDVRVMPPLTTFLSRMLNRPNQNVVVALFGEFARSLPGSDHQPNLTATLIGKYVNVGTTGKTDARVGLPPGTPGIKGFWSCLADAVKAPTNPFGANPHARLIA